jgi:hypothetical protein
MEARGDNVPLLFHNILFNDRIGPHITRLAFNGQWAYKMAYQMDASSFEHEVTCTHLLLNILSLTY